MTRQPDKQIARAIGVMMHLGRYSAAEIADIFGMPIEQLECIIAGDTRNVERTTVISLFDHLAALIDVPLVSDLRGDVHAALASLEERVTRLEAG